MPLLTLQQMQDRLSQFTYKDWDLNIYEGCFEGYKFEVKALEDDTTNPGKKIPLHVISPLMGFFTIEQFDYWIVKRVCIIESHECREKFKFKDSDLPVFNPHAPNADRDLLPDEY